MPATDYSNRDRFVRHNVYVSVRKRDGLRGSRSAELIDLVGASNQGSEEVAGRFGFPCIPDAAGKMARSS